MYTPSMYMFVNFKKFTNIYIEGVLGSLLPQLPFRPMKGPKCFECFFLISRATALERSLDLPLVHHGLISGRRDVTFSMHFQVRKLCHIPSSVL